MEKSRVPLGLVIPLIAFAIFCAPSAALAQGWTPTGGGDHGGQDWTPADGDLIAGVHTNIGLFRVAGGTTVRVSPWNGTQMGSVEIRALIVTIEGTLSASGAGFGGGAGGSNDSCCSSGQTGATVGVNGGGGNGGPGHWGCGGT